MIPETISRHERPAVGLRAEDQPEEDGHAGQPGHAEQVRHGPHAVVARQVVRHVGSCNSLSGSHAEATLSAGVPEPPIGQAGSSWWAASRISPTSSSITSSSVARPEDLPPRVRRRAPCGRPGAAASPARRGGCRSTRTGANGRIHLSSITRCAARLVGLQHVLDVEVAEQLAVVGDDREPAEARWPRTAPRRRPRSSHGARSTSVSGGISTDSTVFSVKPSAPASRSYSSFSSRPSPRDSSTSAATSSRVYVELTSSRSSRRTAAGPAWRSR